MFRKTDKIITDEKEKCGGTGASGYCNLESETGDAGWLFFNN
jgi:hypothetical protein